MVEFVQHRSPVLRRRNTLTAPRRISHRELPWSELAETDDEMWALLDRYRVRDPLMRIELNRGLVLAVAFSLLVWLIVAFTAVELVAAR